MNKSYVDNVNTEDYWESRFGEGDWENRGGQRQTQAFTEGQLRFINIPPNFSGTICDFGCATGDSFPIYHRQWPAATLHGVDFSSSAIKKCEERYGHIANFINGEADDVPNVNYIICSNVFEHLSDDYKCIEILLQKCDVIYVIVPYKEQPLIREHLRSYDETYFKAYNVSSINVFQCAGWTEFGIRQGVVRIITNVKRYLLKQPQIRERLQIIYEIRAS